MFNRLLFLVLFSSIVNGADISSTGLLVDNITDIQETTEVKKYSIDGNVQYSGILPNGGVVIAAQYACTFHILYNCKLELSGKVIEVSKNAKEDFDAMEKLFAAQSGFAKLFTSFK